MLSSRSPPPPHKMAVLRLILRNPQSFIAFSAKSTTQNRELLAWQSCDLGYSRHVSVRSPRKSQKKAEGKRGRSGSPEILIHGLEEEFVVRLVQDLLKIQQSYILGSDGDLHQIRRLLFVDVINNFGFRHGCSFFFSVQAGTEPPESH